MAAKVNLLLAFASGNLALSLAEYENYPSDHDSNYTQLQNSLNTLIDEVSAANLFDAQIPIDILLPRSIGSKGRASTDAARITLSGDVITIGSGIIFIGGRIDVIGAAFDFNPLSADTFFITVDAPSGVLTNATTTPTNNELIATIIWDGASIDLATDLTDNLANGGRSLNTGQSLHLMQQPFDATIPAVSIFSSTHPGQIEPTIQWHSQTGVAGAAGFFANSDDGFIWMSAIQDISPATGTVIAAQINRVGQLMLFEQGRFQVERRTNQSIATGSFAAVSFTAPNVNAGGSRTDRREPENYFADPFLPSGGGVTITVPTGGVLDGTYTFTANIVIDSNNDANFFDVRLRMTDSPASTIARQRVAAAPVETAISISGDMDIQQGDTLQLQIEHDDTGSLNLTFARCTGRFVGAGV